MYKIIDKRSYYHEDRPMPPEVGITAIQAEIEVEAESGERVFLNAEWVDAAPEETAYHAVKESLLNNQIATHKHNDEVGADVWDDEFTRLIDEQNRIKKQGYSKSYFNRHFSDLTDQLDDLILHEMEDHGIAEWFDEEDE